MSFNYQINGVFDMDQKWDMLPNDGAMYCVPAACMNWMYYYATNGFLNAVRFSPPTSNPIARNILRMGDFMDTDAEDGTGADDGFDGLLDWCDDRGVPLMLWMKRAPDNGNLTYTSIRNKLQAGANMVVFRGRYSKSDGVFERIGGHAMTLISLRRTDAGVITMGVHNPNNDSDINTQAAANLQEAEVTEKQRNLEGDHAIVLRWGENSVNPPYLCIDGWMALLPLFAVSNVAAGVLTLYTASLNGDPVKPQQFPLPFKSDIADLALQPAAAYATVIARTTGEVWTLDLGEGTWNKLANVSGAQLITYGGRHQCLFVAKGNQLFAYDEEDKLVRQHDVAAPIDALSFDHAGNRLLVAASGAKRLHSYSPALAKIGEVDAPQVSGTGRLTMTVNSRDQTISLSRHNSSEVRTLRWQKGGVFTTGKFKLATNEDTTAAHVNNKGHLFTNLSGKIACFNADGVRLKGSAFDGLACGPFLKVARSHHSCDPVRSQKKGWKN